MPACSFFSHLSLLCNPSPLLPRYHSSSPCKLSCSEPQRTLLSVELRILIFFNMLASMFLAFSKLCLSSISYLFFKPFPAFLWFFQSFLPAISSFSQRFPQFSLVFPSLPFIFSSRLIVFQHFPPFSSMFPLFLTMFLHFPWFCPTFFLPFSRDLRRIEPHRHLIA